MEEKLSTNYEGKCGNCHSFMSPRDKYCRFCGTLRGKGKFLPYSNEVCYIYGPAIKEVYRCETCGYRWASGQNLKKTRYCPKCRSKQLDKEKQEVLEFWEFFGTDLSENLPKGYQYLSEEEVIKLLDLKSENKEGAEEAAERIAQYGFTDWAKAAKYDEELTEKIAERANLEQIILTDTIGKNPYAMNMNCPTCKGRMIAGIRYKVYNDELEFDGYADLGYPDEKGNGVYLNSEYYWRNCEEDPIYKCLQCGSKFGK